MSTLAASTTVLERKNTRSRSGNDENQLAIAAAVIILITVVPAWAGSGYWTYTAQISCLFVAVAVFQNLLFSDAGQLSVGQGAIFGLAAYVAGAAQSLYGLDYGTSAALGIAAATAAGLLFALPALRVQGFYLGFITLSATIVFPELALVLDDLTNGVDGVVVTVTWFKDNVFLGINLLSYLSALVAIAAVALHVLLRKSQLGRAMRVAAASPECAQSLGINPGLMRCIAFLIAAFGTGVAGVLYPPLVGLVSPDAFKLDLSILFFFAVIVGGRGHPLGPILGLALLYLTPNTFLASMTDYRLLTYGLIALSVMLFFPDGVVGSFMNLVGRRRKDGKTGGIPIDLVTASAAKGVAAESGQLVLQVVGASKSFGKVTALDNVNFDLKSGEIHGLIGANGSGKTSLLNVLTGYSRLDSGTLTMKGRPIKNMPAHELARLGIGRTFQTPRVFPFFDAWENIEIGLDERRGTGAPAEYVESLRAAVSGRNAEWLPHGQRRLIEMLRVALRDSDTLLLDEPAAGLSPTERAEFGHLLRALAHGSGKAIVLVEHDLKLVWGVADRISVLETGRLVATGTPDEVRRNPGASHLFLAKIDA